MQLEELKQEIIDLIDDEARYEALSKAKSECYKRIYERKQKIADYCVQERIPSISMDGNDIKAGFAQKFDILGGKIKAPEKRAQVIGSLIEFGYLDEEKVQRYEATEVNESSLQAAFRKVPYEMQQAWVDQELIRIIPEPTVTIKASKKATAA